MNGRPYKSLLRKKWINTSTSSEQNICGSSTCLKKFAGKQSAAKQFKWRKKRLAKNRAPGLNRGLFYFIKHYKRIIIQVFFIGLVVFPAYLLPLIYVKFWKKNVPVKIHINIG